ncbi:MAG: hypothetical protein JXM72_11060 [Deltaproteobacteria bacterium]|nr:hypothetical protein [Deltaproteobacteria bacterium]
MKKTMIRGITKAFMFALIISIISIAYIQTANAHPPKDISISYDLAQQTLSVTITHKTTFTSRHHIKTVIITRNGTAVSTEEYKDQPDESPFTYTYSLPAVAGDVIKVEVTCNVFGSKEATLTVE